VAPTRIFTLPHNCWHEPCIMVGIKNGSHVTIT